MREIVEPTAKEGNFGRETEHPAFAAIHANRVSGQTNLFGSNIGHSGFVRIEIRAATGQDHGGYWETHFGHGKRYVTVDLSEAQWVSFISRMNQGGGTPCTMRYYRDGEKLVEVPGLPTAKSAQERIESQAERMVESSEGRSEEAAERLLGLLEGKISAKAMSEVKNILGVVLSHTKSTREFQRKCLTETKEVLVTEAKVELNAMVNGIVTRLGLESIEQLVQITQSKGVNLLENR